VVVSMSTGTEGLNDRVLRLLERVDYRRAETERDKEAIFCLRYSAYLREGAIFANVGGKFSDATGKRLDFWGVYRRAISELNSFACYGMWVFDACRGQCVSRSSNSADPGG
jgi:hypothetical protein